MIHIKTILKNRPQWTLEYIGCQGWQHFRQLENPNLTYSWFSVFRVPSYLYLWIQPNMDCIILQYLQLKKNLSISGPMDSNHAIQGLTVHPFLSAAVQFLKQCHGNKETSFCKVMYRDVYDYNVDKARARGQDQRKYPSVE